MICLNEKFFALSEEKRLAIINAGYRIFSQNSYRKSPMSEIADAAGISKSLLFYYFRNKKELYLFLVKKSADTTAEYLQKYNCYEQADFFEIMQSGLKAKIHLMKQYPDIAAFSLKFFYEKDSEVSGELKAFIEEYSAYRMNAQLLKLRPEQFLPGLDLQKMYQDMYWVSAGYLWEKFQAGNIDADAMEKDFTEMIEFWKKIYLRKEGEQ